MKPEHWKLRPVFCAVALICFFLPFATVSCTAQNADIATLSGIQLVTGTEINADSSSSRGVGGGQAQRVDREPLAVLALLAVVVGLGLALWHTRVGAVAAGVAGIAAIAVLLALKSKIDHDVATSGQGLFTVRYQIGFYAVLLLCAGAAVFNLLLLRNVAPTGQMTEPVSTDSPLPTESSGHW
jgi:hypothetical protein